MNESALDKWRRKLAFLQEQEAIAADPSLQFQLQEQIEECRQKIAELEGTESVRQTVIQNIYYQSVDYQNLQKEIDRLKKYLQRIPEDERGERLEVSSDLQKAEERLAQLKQDVAKLYETFNKIEINSERLKQAKAHFDKGEFREADAILQAEEMTGDLDRLIEKEEKLDREKAEVKRSREQIANEFLIKARLWTTFYDQPDRLEQTCRYFEEALRASRAGAILFEYALFLQNHYKLDRAELLYREALGIGRDLAAKNPDAFLPKVADTLNNLAILYSNINQLEIALEEFEEALGIYRDLAAKNSDAFLPDVAMTSVNLSIFYLQDQPDRERSITLALETMEIALQFQQIPTIYQYAGAAIEVLRANGYDSDG
jgi:tetratricopeptide (TPR) repeat protein